MIRVKVSIFFFRLDRPENIQSFIRDSHRVVVFLTDSYVKDDWSVMAVQKV